MSVHLPRDSQVNIRAYALRASRLDLCILTLLAGPLPLLLFTPYALAQGTEYDCGVDDIVYTGGPAGSDPVLGEKTILAILCRYAPDPNDTDPPSDTLGGYCFGSGDRTEIETPEDALPFIFGGQSCYSVNDYCRETSYDQMWLTGNVVGYCTLDIPTSSLPPWQELLSLITTQALTCAEENYPVQPDNYDRVVFFVPELWPRAEFGGRFAWCSNVRACTIVHELGHTFGLVHPAAWECGCRTSAEVTLVRSDFCDVLVAYHPWDVMGMGCGHFSAASKEQLGWLGGAQTVDVTENGEFVLTPVETPSGLKTLWIPLDFPRAYSVEFRQPVGRDLPLFESWYTRTDGAATLDGVLIYDVPYDPYGHRVYLIGTTPESGRTDIVDTPDGALAPGESFLDLRMGVRIEAGALVNPGADAEITVKVAFSSVEVDLGPDRQIVWDEGVTIEPVITGGSPPYSCEWIPPLGLDDPTSCTAVTVRYEPEIHKCRDGTMCTDQHDCICAESMCLWPADVYEYTISVTDSEADSVARGDSMEVKILYEDCNNNDLPDPLDVGSGSSEDCNGNVIPDECEVDCNATGFPDDCDVAEGRSEDLDQDGWPDECRVLYVDVAAQPGGDGLSWDTAFVRLQDMLAIAAGGAVREMWVAAGAYTPTEPNGNRSATFQLVSGLGVYGGFTGVETTREERDPATNVTVLSGDLNGDDASPSGNSENSQHVVTMDGTDSTAVLDGFVIRGGHSPLSYLAGGAGVRCVSGDATLSKCIITENVAVAGGGESMSMVVNRVLYSAYLPRTQPKTVALSRYPWDIRSLRGVCLQATNLRSFMVGVFRFLTAVRG